MTKGNWPLLTWLEIDENFINLDGLLEFYNSNWRNLKGNLYFGNDKEANLCAIGILHIILSNSEIFNHYGIKSLAFRHRSELGHEVKYALTKRL